MWGSIKKAVNSNFSKPLNVLIDDIFSNISETINNNSENVNTELSNIEKELSKYYKISDEILYEVEPMDLTINDDGISFLIGIFVPEFDGIIKVSASFTSNRPTSTHILAIGQLFSETDSTIDVIESIESLTEIGDVATTSITQATIISALEWFITKSTTSYYDTVTPKFTFHIPVKKGIPLKIFGTTGYNGKTSITGATCSIMGSVVSV